MTSLMCRRLIYILAWCGYARFIAWRPRWGRKLNFSLFINTLLPFVWSRDFGSHHQEHQNHLHNTIIRHVAHLCVGVPYHTMSHTKKWVIKNPSTLYLYYAAFFMRYALTTVKRSYSIYFLTKIWSKFRKFELKW